MTASRDVLRRLNDAVVNTALNQIQAETFAEAQGAMAFAGPYTSEIPEEHHHGNVRTLWGTPLGPGGPLHDTPWAVLWWVVRNGSWYWEFMPVAVQDRRDDAFRAAWVALMKLRGNKGKRWVTIDTSFFLGYLGPKTIKKLRYDSPRGPEVFMLAFPLRSLNTDWPVSLSEPKAVAPYLKEANGKPFPYRSLSKRWNVDAGNFKYRKVAP